MVRKKTVVPRPETPRTRGDHKREAKKTGEASALVAALTDPEAQIRAATAHGLTRRRSDQQPQGTSQGEESSLLVKTPDPTQDPDNTGTGPATQVGGEAEGGDDLGQTGDKTGSSQATANESALLTEERLKSFFNALCSGKMKEFEKWQAQNQTTPSNPNLSTAEAVTQGVQCSLSFSDLDETGQAVDKSKEGGSLSVKDGETSSVTGSVGSGQSAEKLESVAREMRLKEMRLASDVSRDGVLDALEHEHETAAIYARALREMGMSQQEIASLTPKEILTPVKDYAWKAAKAQQEILCSPPKSGKKSVTFLGTGDDDGTNQSVESDSYFPPLGQAKVTSPGQRTFQEKEQVSGEMTGYTSYYSATDGEGDDIAGWTIGANFGTTNDPGERQDPPTLNTNSKPSSSGKRPPGPPPTAPGSFTQRTKWTPPPPRNLFQNPAQNAGQWKNGAWHSTPSYQQQAGGGQKASQQNPLDKGGGRSNYDQGNASYKGGGGYSQGGGSGVLSMGGAGGGGGRPPGGNGGGKKPPPTSNLFFCEGNEEEEEAEEESETTDNSSKSKNIWAWENLYFRLSEEQQQLALDAKQLDSITLEELFNKDFVPPDYDVYIDRLKRRFDAITQFDAKHFYSKTLLLVKMIELYRRAVKASWFLKHPTMTEEAIDQLFLESQHQVLITSLLMEQHPQENSQGQQASTQDKEKECQETAPSRSKERGKVQKRRKKKGQGRRESKRVVDQLIKQALANDPDPGDDPGSSSSSSDTDSSEGSSLSLSADHNMVDAVREGQKLLADHPGFKSVSAQAKLSLADMVGRLKLQNVKLRKAKTLVEKVRRHDLETAADLRAGGRPVYQDILGPEPLEADVRQYLREKEEVKTPAQTYFPVYDYSPIRQQARSVLTGVRELADMRDEQVLNSSQRKPTALDGFDTCGAIRNFEDGIIQPLANMGSNVEKTVEDEIFNNMQPQRPAFLEKVPRAPPSNYYNRFLKSSYLKRWKTHIAEKSPFYGDPLKDTLRIVTLLNYHRDVCIGSELCLEAQFELLMDVTADSPRGYVEASMEGGGTMKELYEELVDLYHLRHNPHQARETLRRTLQILPKEALRHVLALIKKECIHSYLTKTSGKASEAAAAGQTIHHTYQYMEQWYDENRVKETLATFERIANHNRKKGFWPPEPTWKEVRVMFSLLQEQFENTRPQEQELLIRKDEFAAMASRQGKMAIQYLKIDPNDPKAKEGNGGWVPLKDTRKFLVGNQAANIARQKAMEKNMRQKAKVSSMSYEYLEELEKTGLANEESGIYQEAGYDQAGDYLQDYDETAAVDNANESSPAGGEHDPGFNAQEYVSAEEAQAAALVQARGGRDFIRPGFENACLLCNAKDEKDHQGKPLVYKQCPFYPNEIPNLDPKAERMKCCGGLHSWVKVCRRQAADSGKPRVPPNQGGGFANKPGVLKVPYNVANKGQGPRAPPR